MSGHPRAFQRLANELAAATTPTRSDELLDEWLNARDRATEWDADQWGLDPDGWCLKERTEMERRATTTEEPTP